MNQRSATMPTLALCALLGSCGGGDSQPTSGATREVASNQKSSCSLSSTSGIEGTGLRNKLTGRITGITTPSSNAGGNTTVAVGSTCSFTADGASVFRGNVPAGLSDLRVDQIITAEGDFGSPGNLSATSIFILENGANGQLPLVQLGTNFAPTVRGTWYLFDGPEYSVLPQAQVLVDGDLVNVTGLTIGEGEIVLLGGQDSFPDSNNPGGLLASSAVKITHMVDGPADAIDIPHNRIVVLGQTVLFSDGFQLYPGDINVGDRVTVSGHPTASGPIVATLIALSAKTGDFLVSGVVRAADPAQHVFTLNGVEIDYATAQLSGVPAGGPTDGERILVRALRPANGNVLTATSISDDSKILGAGMGTVVALHGIVTQVYSSSLVSVDGYFIRISYTALQTCGSTPPANSDVTLQGTIEADGTILADIYCFTGNASAAATAPTAPGTVQGTIQAIDPNYGTISILGFSAQPSLTTRVMDSSGSMLSLGNLKVGDAIAVDGGYGSIPGLVFADGILRIPSGAQPLVRAYFPSDLRLADPTLYVRGLPIATDSSTTYSPLTRAAFFHGSWPLFDIHCQPSVSINVRMNPDGSLTAISVTETPHPC